jgi:hypothetical protein
MYILAAWYAYGTMNHIVLTPKRHEVLLFRMNTDTEEADSEKLKQGQVK